ncbi:MAG TPA: hypothetical protein VER33_08855 [Polyangiaceae bacterium]|nr:hypothetical protein [Polyangiaceae bacterium]
MSAKKILLVLTGLFLSVLLMLGVVLALLVPRWIKDEVVRAALARGIELSPGEIRYGWGWAQVSSSRVTLLGVRGLKADVGIVDVELAGFEPQRFTVNRVQVEAVGEPSELARQLQVWLDRHRAKLREPLFIKPLGLTLRPSAQAAPVLLVEGAGLQLTPERSTLEAGRVALYGKELGALRLGQEKNLTRLNLTLGISSLDNALVAAELADGSTRTLHVALSPVALGPLGKALGLQLPLPEVRLSGSFDASVPNNLAVGGRVSGRTDLELFGYIPPHPVELNGFVFGDTTTLQATWTLEPERLRVVIGEARVKAGTFELKGPGELRVEGDHARLTLALRGALPCTELAAARAESRLGRALGKVTGKAARQVLSGSVGIRVSVDADSRAPDQARVLRTIAPGCGLRPLSLKELVELGELAPEVLDPAVGRDFQQLLADTFPGLPKAPPAIEIRLPTLKPLPFPRLPSAGSRQVAPAPRSSGK